MLFFKEINYFFFEINLFFSILALISKTVYLPLVFSISVITYLLLRNRLNKIIFSIFVSLSFTFHLWWMQFSKPYINEMYRHRRGELSGVGLQSFADFLDFGKAIIKTTLFKSEDLLRQIHGVFGNGPIARLLLPNGYHLLFLITLSIILIFLFYKRIINKKKFMGSNKNNLKYGFLNNLKNGYFLIGLIILFSLLSSYIAIYYAFYIYWARDPILVDIQGRYFLPIIFFFVPSIYYLTTFSSDEKSDLFIRKKYKSKIIINKIEKNILKIDFNQIKTLFSASNILIYLVNIFGYYSLKRIFDYF